ncbi:alpha/beta fold hydrolase [Paenibacillus graminis]|uniref:Uncharacterized protein n=1 Tax=Paenibacillus graminis TaxID=189425 RepID=A0A089M6R8_9BACL|nr:hypothetical protein [Paenibacillus graminis]AIQ69491.1 hypothetical protein PGRAT_18965 [Paenibacillus graminis]
MLKLTEILLNGNGEIASENSVFIPVDVVFRTYKVFTDVTIPGAGHALVKESPQEIANMILDYKLAMERYKASSVAAYLHHSQDGNNPYTPPLDQELIFGNLAGVDRFRKSTAREA